MTSIPGADIGKTYDCKTRDCANASRSPVGRYASGLSTQRDVPLGGRTVSVPLGASTGFEAKVKQLQLAAREADKLAAHAKKLTETALAAKANADKATERVREIAADLSGR